MPDAHDSDILIYLHRHGGYQSPDQVAAALGLPPSDVRDRLRVLQKAGAVVPFDATGSRYGLTYQGIEAATQAHGQAA